MSLDITLYYDKTTLPVDAWDDGREVVFERNITHNLNRMAKIAGVYEAMWRPEEIGAHKADDLSQALPKGFIFMIDNREECEALNPENGWGNYEGLLNVILDYLKACNKYPDAKVRAYL